MRHFVCNVFILDVKCHLRHFNEVSTILPAKEQKHKDDDDEEDDEEDNNEIKSDNIKQS